jgi:predicted transcriptional regulator
MEPKSFKHLRSLGFSDYEIKAYVALLTHGAMNGYRLAKLSGIPRANIYAVLDRLVERGAVSSSDADGGQEYQALPAEEMLARLSESLQTSVSEAKDALKDIDPAAQHPLAWNMRGYDTVVSAADRLVRGARHSLSVGLWPEEAGKLAPAFAQVLKRFKPTVLCLHGCEQECGGCAGRIYRYPMAPAAPGRSLVLVADQSRTLLAQINADGTAVGAHSTTPVLATMATQHLLNAIAVAEIVRSLGPKLLRIVDDEAIQALKGAGLAIDHQSWFDRISSVIDKMEKEKRV